MFLRERYPQLLSPEKPHATSNCVKQLRRTLTIPQIKWHSNSGFPGILVANEVNESEPAVTKLRVFSIALGLLIGILVGYLNLRFGLKGFFVINDRDTPLVLLLFLGYVALLPLTIAGIFYPRQASNILLIVTAVAFACGLFSSFSLRAVMYMGGRFVLPNVMVALLLRIPGKALLRWLLQGKAIEH
jgi:hypothetical protein